MAERQCVVTGCDSFPDAGWSICAPHADLVEAQRLAALKAAFGPTESTDPRA